jgi:TRAP-type C4-dicarboxylate transport system permease small subunit
VQVALIWLTYLALAGAMRTGSLIAVDMALRVSTPRIRAVLRLFGLVTTMGLLLVILWFGAMLVWRVRFQTVAGLGMSASWAYLALPVGAVLSILALVAHVLDPAQRDAAAPDSAG